MFDIYTCFQFVRKRSSMDIHRYCNCSIIMRNSDKIKRAILFSKTYDLRIYEHVHALVVKMKYKKGFTNMYTNITQLISLLKYVL